jgi:hypothetical protein
LSFIGLSSSFFPIAILALFHFLCFNSVSLRSHVQVAVVGIVMAAAIVFVASGHDSDCEL